MRLSPTSRRPQTPPADGPHAGRGQQHHHRHCADPAASTDAVTRGVLSRCRADCGGRNARRGASSDVLALGGSRRSGSDSLRLGVYPLTVQNLDPPFSPAHEARALVRKVGRMWYSSPGMKWGPLPSCGKHPDLQEPAPQKTMRLEGRRMRRPYFGGPLTIVRRRCSDGRKTCPLRAGVPSPALVGRWIGAVPRCRRTRGHHRR